MATELPGFSRSRIAAADLSAKQFTAVIEDNAGKINAATTQGALIFGVLQDKPKSGASGQVMITGQTMWVAGAAIPFLAGGTPVMVDASGRCIAATSTNQIVGFLAGQQSAPTAAGQIVAVELRLAGTKP